MENKRIKEKVVGMLTKIVDQVDPRKVFDLLMERRIIDIDDKERIMNKETMRDRCRALLDHLLKCSHSEAFIVFRQALEEHYHWIVENIDVFDACNENQDDFNTKSSMTLMNSVFIVGFFDARKNQHQPTRDVVKVNLNQSADISSIQQIPAEMTIESAAAVYGDSIFVTGIGNRLNEIWRFDSKSSKWTQCASLARSGRRHSVAFVGDILYICGGWVVGQGKPLDDVEAYDTRRNRCNHVGNLAWAVESAGNCVPFKSSLYIFGGNGANSIPLDKIQVYDTKSNTGSVLKENVLRDANFLRAEVWENTVILLGILGSYIYNFETDVLSARNAFKTDTFYYGLTLSDRFVYVFGGGDIKDAKWFCRDDVRRIPIENILNDQPINWETCVKPKLPEPTLVYAYGSVAL